MKITGLDIKLKFFYVSLHGFLVQQHKVTYSTTSYIVVNELKDVSTTEFLFILKSPFSIMVFLKWREITHF